METKPRICFIVNPYSEPKSRVILMMRFGSETEEDVRRHLDAALATLPFDVFYSCVTFELYGEAIQLLRSMEMKIEEIEDFPGAEIVSLHLSVDWEKKYYLPRDPVTKEFVDIDKQIQCLSVLVHHKDKNNGIWKKWLAEKKEELGIA